ncbi:MAG TPA: hypothetical protein VFI42_18110, partial [Thermomicrobiaceae bacterium]|nr:hypothetical protein [Thermomicrobiaceae bacterium]
RTTWRRAALPLAWAWARAWARPRAAWAPAAFTLAAALTLGCYALLWLPPLWLFRFPVFVDKNPDIGVILGLSAGGMLRYGALVLIPYACYFAALALLPHTPRRLALRGTLLVGVIAPLLLLATYPAFAADVFQYLLSGRLMVAHHANPYTVPPSAIPGDPYFPPVVWRDLLANYGPAWLWLSAVPVALAGAHRVLALLLLKGLMVAAHLTTAWLVYRTVRRIAPERATQALLAYLWNPLVIVSFAVDGHNDALLVLCLAAALALALGGYWEGAFPALTLGVLVKFVPLVLFPIFLLAARRSRRRAALGLAGSALLAVVFYHPFWAGTHTFDGVLKQGSLLTSSPASLLSHLAPVGLLRPLFGAAFAAGYLLLLRRVHGLPERAFAAIILYLVTLSFWTKGWYFTWPLALAALVGGDVLTVAAVATLGAFVATVFWGWMLPMDWWGMEGPWGLVPLDLTMGLSLYLPWFLGAVWLWRRRGGRAGERPSTTLAARSRRILRLRSG